MGKKILYFLIGFVVVVLAVVGTASFFLDTPRANRTARGIAEIRIDGIIMSSPAPGLAGMGMASAPRITSLIDRAARDERVQGLLLVINSPGGGAAASQEIFQELLHFKETGKPVVVSMGETAASGGYYVAAPADYIFASPASMTGSIGAIMELVDASELLENLGLEMATLKAGEFKDAGSFSRALTAMEEEYFQDMVETIQQQFLDDVLKARPLEEEVVERVSDGRIILGSEALELGMVDELGNVNDARRFLAAETGLPDAPPIIVLEEKTFVERWLGLEAQRTPRIEEALMSIYNYGIRLLY